MQTTITKWGNSLAIRLPKTFAEQIGVNEKNKIEITIEKDKIILQKPKQNLESLLSKINKDNTHKETDTGKINGKEIW